MKIIILIGLMNLNLTCIKMYDDFVNFFLYTEILTKSSKVFVINNCNMSFTIVDSKVNDGKIVNNDEELELSRKFYINKNNQNKKFGEKYMQVEELYTLQNIQKIENLKYPHLGNNDFYLRYEKRTSANIETLIAHFIPKTKNRYFVEENLISEEYISGKNQDGHDLWSYTVYDESPKKKKGYADESVIYSKLLKYYLSHKSEIKIIK